MNIWIDKVFMLISNVFLESLITLLKVFVIALYGDHVLLFVFIEIYGASLQLVGKFLHEFNLI